MLTLDVTTRDPKTDTRVLHEQGNMPAVYYGSKTDSTPITIDTGDFISLMHDVGESTVFILKDENDNELQALVHDLQIHPVTNQPLHADFYVIEEGQTVTVDVPISFVGTAPAVKNLGGLLVRVLHTIEVEAEPAKLPSEIEVDVSELEEFDQQITIGEVEPPEGVTFLAEDDTTIVSVSEPIEEEEPEIEEEPDLENIEVEEKGKGEDIEGEEGEAADAGGEAQEGGEEE